MKRAFRFLMNMPMNYLTAFLVYLMREVSKYLKSAIIKSKNGVVIIYVKKYTDMYRRHFQKVLKLAGTRLAPVVAAKSINIAVAER